METIKREQFVNDYIETWSTTKAEVRKKLVEKVYSTSADFYAHEPSDEAVHHHGLEAIFGNISQVNELLVGKGLITESTGYSENHDTLKITWQMKTTNGEVALRGMNFLQIDPTGRIKKDCIFVN